MGFNFAVLSQRPSSTCAGYWLRPPVWVAPPPLEPLSPELHSFDPLEPVLDRELPQGIRARVIRDGTFLFDFADWPEANGDLADWNARGSAIAARVSVLNAHLACLYAAFGLVEFTAVLKMVLTAADPIGVASLAGTAEELVALRPADTLSEQRDMSISLEVLTASFDLLDAVLVHREPQAIQLVNLHHRACASWEQHEYGQCLSNEWTVIETMLHTLWRYHTARTTGVGEPPAPAPAQPTAAWVINSLREAQVLPPSLHDEVTRLRQARNAWLHRLEPVSGETAGLSTRVAGQLLEGTWGLPFRSWLVGRMPG